MRSGPLGGGLLGSGARGASVRRFVRIDRSVHDVWERVGAPERLHEWFPGMVSSDVDGTTRVVVTEAGLPMPEEILEVDPIQHRLRYRITAPVFTHHQGTIDLIDLGDETTLVTYTTEADPPAMALVIGGATGAALEELKKQLEA